MNEVKVVALGAVEPIPLSGGSWSRMLVSPQTVDKNETCLGYSVFTPGMTTTPMSHVVEELAYVISGNGALSLDDGVVPMDAGTAVHIPAEVWHAVTNPGDEDLVMVFVFSSPGYPETQRRDVEVVLPEVES